jgi:excisionase family DNA binding protein
MADPTDQTKFQRRFLSVREVSQLTGIDASLIRKAIKSGELPAIQLSSAANSKMRIDRDDFQRWLERMKQSPDRE